MLINDRDRFRLLKLLEADPKATQRKLANELGMSLGKINYCLRALVAKGLVKASNFKNSNNKSAYIYILTPKGIEERAVMTVRFLEHKLAEHECLTAEIEELRAAVKEIKRERA
jgi:EPS-associated MarR family transcriptional regulator